MVVVLMQCSECRADTPGVEAISFVTGAWENARAWKTLDVLLRVECEAEVKDVGYISEKSYIRIVADFPNDRFLCVSEGNKTIDSLDLENYEKDSQNDKKGSHGKKLNAFVWNENGARIYDFPNPVRSHIGNPLERLSSMKIPDVRCIGLARFPVMYNADKYGLGFESLFRYRSNLADATKREPSDSTVEFRIERPIEAKDVDAKAVATREYDVISLMPRRYAVSYLITESGIARSQPLYLEVYDWKDWDGTGVYVPIRILSDEQKVYQAKLSEGGEKKLRPYNLSTTVTCRWFSVNENMDEDKFAFSRISDTASVRSLVKPDLMDDVDTYIRDEVRAKTKF